MNPWQQYVALVAGGHTQTEIAGRTGLAQTSIGRWINGTKRPTEAAKVAAFAQGFGRNVLEAFVAAEMLTLEQAGAGLGADSLETLAQLGIEPDPKVSVLRPSVTPSPANQPPAAAEEAVAAHDDEGHTIYEGQGHDDYA